jgi:hypothetical protein
MPPGCMKLLAVKALCRVLVLKVRKSGGGDAESRESSAGYRCPIGKYEIVAGLNFNFSGRYIIWSACSHDSTIGIAGKEKERTSVAGARQSSYERKCDGRCRRDSFKLHGPPQCKLYAAPSLLKRVPCTLTVHLIGCNKPFSFHRQLRHQTTEPPSRRRFSIL